MNRRASQGIMRPVLPEERMVGPVVVSSNGRGGDNAGDELPMNSDCYGSNVLVGQSSSNRNRQTNFLAWPQRNR